MQLIKWMLFLSLLITGTSALAAEDKCEAITWPYARNQSGADNQKLFLLNPRYKLEAFLIAEMTENLPASGVSYDLARFLIDTEKDEMKKSFYEVLRWGADLYDRKSKPKRMKLDKVCEIRAKLIK